MRVVAAAIARAGTRRLIARVGLQVGQRVDRVAAAIPLPFPGPGLAIRVVGGEVTRERMFVLGSHGRGSVGSAVLGSVATAVAQHSHLPVMICRPAERS